MQGLQRLSAVVSQHVFELVNQVTSNPSNFRSQTGVRTKMDFSCCLLYYMLGQRGWDEARHPFIGGCGL